MNDIKLLFFASLAERLQCREYSVELTSETHTVGKLVDHLSAQDGKWQALKGKNIKVAVNQSIVTLSHEINEGDEVAFFPPVTGG